MKDKSDELPIGINWDELARQYAYHMWERLSRGNEGIRMMNAAPSHPRHRCSFIPVPHCPRESRDDDAAMFFWRCDTGLWVEGGIDVGLIP